MVDWLYMSDIALMAEGELLGEDAAIRGISTDTRNIKEGDLFIALKGERYDAHDFISDAIKQAAKGIFIHKDI
ncbi:MAG: Mur ligase domain-containing protein, partial [Pseudomonadota bacterium]